MWNSGELGFKEEVASSDNTFQPYRIILIINADGTDKRPLTDSPWEGTMTCFVLAKGNLRLRDLSLSI